MISAHLYSNRVHERAQRGFTLVELMIAMAIAVFLLGGLMAIVQSTRRAYGNQSSLAQLQDNERLAMTLMADVIETAGYFPDPRNNSAVAVMPVSGAFLSAGQSIVGTSNAAAPGDSITVRYGVGLNDNAFSCIGSTNTAVAPYTTFENTFHVLAAPANQLVCTFGGVDYPLVNGVQNLSIVYGVKKSGANTGSCTDTYLPASSMAPADWNAVCSVNVTLTFVNPINPAAAGITITRVIAVMNTAGVNT